jgi:predicted nucleotidyltransferase
MARRTQSGASGRFVLRLPSALHAALQSAARATGVSLNEYCVRRLAVSGIGAAADPAATAIVGRAAELAADSLIGVVLYGSWARGDATASSDVDLLVVVDRHLSLTRTLYRRWDSRELRWQGRPVDAHFTHLPGDQVTGGLWPEVAVDGLVLFERDWQISSQLVRIRRAIAEGRLVRRVTHGQPYWVTPAA